MLMFYDMDNTIAEMSKKLSGIYSGCLKDYCPAGTEEEAKEKLNTEGFFQDLTVIQGAGSTLKKLIKIGHDVRILSQPMERYSSIDEKNYWLNSFFPFIPRHKRIYTFDKYLLAGKGRILVDDNISHLTKWSDYDGLSICFERGYNKNWQGIFSIKKHKEIFQILEDIEKVGWI